MPTLGIRAEFLNLRRLANNGEAGSLSNQLRARRFQWFEKLIAPLPRPLRILDIGGTTLFWEQRGWAGRDDAHITLVNLKAEDARYANIEPTAGDATRLPHYADQTFDVVFSNSVIEHLFTLENQLAMAREVQRIGRAYWVQTPNYWFPIEPHFHLPAWQWMPEGVRVAILRRRRCGWRGRTPDPDRARQVVREVRLMTRRELTRAFPGATIVPERLFGMVKSWVVVGGFAAS